LYEGIFRKGYLAPYSTTLPKSRSSLPKRKYHNNQNEGWTGEAAHVNRERKPETFSAQE